MIQFYHNSRCGKSRDGLAILQESGKDFTTINYLETPPSESELEDIIKKLDIRPIDLVRKNESIWKEQFKDRELDDKAIIDAMVKHPILIERPIVINGTRATIGRPPLKILAII